MKKAILLIFILLVVPFVYADISITVSGEVFNLGDIISVESKVTRDSDMNGFYSMDLVCGDTRHVIQLNPVILKANVAQDFSMDVPIKSSYAGDCVFEVSVKDHDDNVVDEVTSNDVLITSELDISAEVDNADPKPGETVTVTASFSKKNIENEIKNPIVAVRLGGDSNNVQIEGNSFVYDLVVPSDISSGVHNIFVYVVDDEGNNAEFPLEIDIESVPTTIEVILSENEFNPKDSVEMDVVLLDQAGEPYSGDISMKISDAVNTVVYEKMVSPGDVVYELGEFASPGNYLIETSVGDLFQQDTFRVLEVNDIGMSYEGEMLIITNHGNVIYHDDLRIELDSGDKDYVMLADLMLNPGESFEYLLSEQVPTSVYNLNAELGSGLLLNEEGIELVDRRSFFKKVKDWAVDHPILTGIIIILLIGLIVVILKMNDVKFMLKKYLHLKPKKDLNKSLGSHISKNRDNNPVKKPKVKPKTDGVFDDKGNVKPDFGNSDEEVKPKVDPEKPDIEFNSEEPKPDFSKDFGNNAEEVKPKLSKPFESDDDEESMSDINFKE